MSKSSNDTRCITVVPIKPEGFGSLLQFALATYFVAKQSGFVYTHSKFSFEHSTQEGKSQEQWDRELNDAIPNFFIPCVSSSSNHLVIYPEKFPLEYTIKNNQKDLEELKAYYRDKTRDIPCYFEPGTINIAIHGRTYNSTDCDPSDFRELLSTGSISDLFIQNMIQQLTDWFPKAKFHLYIKTSSVVPHYRNIPNVIIHDQSSVLEDLHHMIKADLLIMAKSSMSSIASYYRTGPCLINQRYGYATPSNVMFVQKEKINDDQKSAITLSFRSNSKHPKPKAAICCSGQLREGRFFARNHKRFLTDHLLSLGYEVSLFWVTDGTCSQRSNNGKLSWRYTPEDPERIKYYFDTIRSGTSSSHITILEQEERKEDDNGLILQMIKIVKVLEQAAENGSFDIIVRYRPDVYLNRGIPIPGPNDIIQTSYPSINYESDVIQIFHGSWLNKAIKALDQYPRIKGHTWWCPEGHITGSFRSIGMIPKFEPYLANYWRNEWNHYFPEMDWKYYEDRVSIESPPYKFDLIKAARNKIDPNLVSRVSLTDWPCDSDPEWFQRVWLAATEPDIVTHICSDSLKQFVETELIKDTVALIPIAGTASRMNQLPKFLLPCPGNEPTLLDHCLSKIRRAGIEHIYAGVSTANNSLLFSKTGFKRMTVETKTMAETIFRLTEVISRKYLMIMPDTYWTPGNELQNLMKKLDQFELAITLWPMRPDQRGKVGQCKIDNGLVIDVRDKDKTCEHEYMWGALAWRKSMNDFIDPNSLTIGSLIEEALRRKIPVGYEIANSSYFDCGTPAEYFQMIRSSSGEPEKCNVPNPV